LNNAAVASHIAIAENGMEAGIRAGGPGGRGLSTKRGSLIGGSKINRASKTPKGHGDIAAGFSFKFTVWGKIVLQFSGSPSVRQGGRSYWLSKGKRGGRGRNDLGARTVHALKPGQTRTKWFWGMKHSELRENLRTRPKGLTPFLANLQFHAQTIRFS